MFENRLRKAIIVEGKTDKERLLGVLDEPVDIVCTFGTMSIDKIEELMEISEYNEVYVFVDADEAGQNLRRKIKNEYPQIKDLFTRKKYKEVATTPIDELTKILNIAHFLVKDNS